MGFTVVRLLGRCSGRVPAKPLASHSGPESPTFLVNFVTPRMNGAWLDLFSKIFRVVKSRVVRILDLMFYAPA